ncbi:hypothetical protein FXF51_05950 [Nonomuraea sp. PA05]|uniref:hypothetical protein n=1 Tax=Nonomuraea sp. PA05 TaxID=2604466 RepID=UPI0011D450E3|nr:hypothetical protein [Nonomuraea sp. PA05]TYB69703.1 hypothetical protein FXF51_05950 [Nonomuraea sp. PA05]
MPDLPEEAVQAAASAISRMLFSGQPEYGTWMEHDEDLARAAVEAAAPVLAAQACVGERARCIADLRARAATERALPQERRAAGEPTVVADLWQGHDRAMSLEWAAEVLATENGGARDGGEHEHRQAAERLLDLVDPKRPGYDPDRFDAFLADHGLVYHPRMRDTLKAAAHLIGGAHEPR